MKSALDLIITEHKTIRSVSKLKNIPFTTLRRYYKKYINSPQTSIKLTPNYAVRKIFTNDQEATLVKYITDCCQMFYGLTLLEIRKLAYEMAVINKMENIPASWHKKTMASVDWLYHFRKRHSSLSLRSPEGCSLARATSFNRHNVDIFYKNLKAVLQRNECFANGTRIFNLDETATTTVQRPHKVLGVKGQKQISKVTSGEKGVLVTTCCFVSATGNTLPPVMIFPRVHFKQHMLKGAPSGTLGLATQTGWMNTELFVKTMEHFIKNTNSSQENPSLLIIDNYEAHISLQVLNLAKENGVTVLTLPPHSSGKLQPLDVGIFKPFKNYYNAAVESWMLKNPGHPITIYEIAACVGEAHLKAMTPLNICNAFRKTGIFPYDDNIFTDVDFLPSSVTDRTIEISSMCHNLNGINKVNSRTREIPVEVPVAGISAEPREDIVQNYSRKINEESPASTSFDVSNNSLQPLVSPFVFRGLPKAGARKLSKPRRKGKSIIATDTPEKLEIEKRNSEKIAKKAACIKRKILQDSEEENEDNFSVYSDDDLSMDEETDETVITPQSLTVLKSTPEEGQFVLVEFNSNNRKIYYIAKVLSIKGHEVDVSFLRKCSKMDNTFRMPDLPDLSSVSLNDIKLILPFPDVLGSTKRQQSFYTFKISFEQFDLR